jgi:NDP-sugar pyrophosphorylase family protein
LTFPQTLKKKKKLISLSYLFSCFVEKNVDKPQVYSRIPLNRKKTLISHSEKVYKLLMDSFRALDFFELDQFEHASLFHADEVVWEVLKKIHLFLMQHPLGKIEGSIDPRAYLIHPELISIGEGSIVEPGAYIKGPCWIGKNCEIRHGAYIRGDFICGNHCVIGHATEVKNSVLLDHAQAGHFAYIGDSVIGNSVNLGAGTKCANLRLDHENIFVRFGDKKINSQLKKFGAIIGDHAQLGCNAVTNPGSLIGKGARCYPCVNVRGFVPENYIVRSSEQTTAT